MNKIKVIEVGKSEFEKGVFRGLNPYRNGWRRKAWFLGWDIACGVVDE